MVVFDEKQHRCRLCGNYYSDSDMSGNTTLHETQEMKMLLLLISAKCLIHLLRRVYMLRLEKS